MNGFVIFLVFVKIVYEYCVWVKICVFERNYVS